MNVSSILNVENVSQKFLAGTANELQALAGVTITVSEGEFVIVIGPNGSGKSSLLKAVFEGQLTSGYVSFLGKDLADTPPYRRAKRIGYVTQHSSEGTLGELSILENLALASSKANRAGMVRATHASRTEDAIERLRSIHGVLADRLDTPVCNLSGGERQIVSVLMMLLGGPTLILCDEPTASTDKDRTLSIEQLVLAHVKATKSPVLWVTHNPDQVVRLGTRLIVLCKGRVALDIDEDEKRKLSRDTVFDLIQRS
jgi:putative ABC transport system ATP-binding protein